jgi:hypothetical protein
MTNHRCDIRLFRRIIVTRTNESTKIYLRRPQFIYKHEVFKLVIAWIAFLLHLQLYLEDEGK